LKRGGGVITLGLVLRRRVAEGAREHLGGVLGPGSLIRGGRRPAALPRAERQPKVRHPGPALAIDEHVARLHVSVDHPRLRPLSQYWNTSPPKYLRGFAICDPQQQGTAAVPCPGTTRNVETYLLQLVLQSNLVKRELFKGGFCSKRDVFGCVNFPLPN